MKRAFAPLVVLTLVMSTALAAQSKPSFAGTWKLASDPSASPMTASQLVASDDGKVLTVMSTSQFGESKTIYNFDGSPAKSPLEFNGAQIERTTKAVWEGTNLVLTTTSDFGGMPFEIKQVMSLGADGTLSVQTTFPDFQGGGAPTTTTATYKKG